MVWLVILLDILLTQPMPYERMLVSWEPSRTQAQCLIEDNLKVYSCKCKENQKIYKKINYYVYEKSIFFTKGRWYDKITQKV